MTAITTTWSGPWARGRNWCTEFGGVPLAIVYVYEMLSRTTEKQESTTVDTRHSSLGLSVTAALVVAAFLGATPATADDDSTRRPKDDGYRGIWFTLGQFSDAPYGRGSWKSFWDYGDKNSGGNGTYTAKHVPIAIYAP